jgi:hypothetical protein
MLNRPIEFPQAARLVSSRPEHVHQTSADPPATRRGTGSGIAGFPKAAPKPSERLRRQNNPFGYLRKHGRTDIGNAIPMLSAEPASEVDRFKVECGEPTPRLSMFLDPLYPSGGSPKAPMQPRMACATNRIRMERIVVIFAVILEWRLAHPADRAEGGRSDEPHGHRPPYHPSASGALKPRETVIAAK